MKVTGFRSGNYKHNQVLSSSKFYCTRKLSYANEYINLFKENISFFDLFYLHELELMYTTYMMETLEPRGGHEIPYN